MPESNPYEGLECGMCGNPISPGEWCGEAGEEEDCPLAFDGPPSASQDLDTEEDDGGGE